MRNFRNATLAVATATAMTFGGAAVAIAAPGADSALVQNQATGSSNETGSSNDQNTSANDRFAAVDAFGEEKHPENVPAWAKSWNTASIVASIGAVIGLIIAGFNFASYNGWINF